MHHPFENVVEFQPGKTNERVVFSSLTQVFDASPSASSLSPLLRSTLVKGSRMSISAVSGKPGIRYRSAAQVPKSVI
jgi:hypothetical protein